MAAESNNLIGQAIDQIFANNKLEAKKFKTKAGSKVSQKELEVALTIILVDLASCDQNFEPGEYTIIMNGLKRIFNTSKEQVSALVNQAQNTLKNLRGTQRFGELLRDNLDDDGKKAILEVVEELISADGVEDGFETYLRQKITNALGISLPKAQ